MNFFDLDKPILEFNSPSGSSQWTFRHAMEGVGIWGGIGAGKSSSSGRMLACKFLMSGMGGLVLTVKPTEKLEWIEYCSISGRTQDLIVYEPGGKYHFNFLAYEASQGEGSYTENIVDVLKTVIRAAEKDSGKTDDAFWENALEMLIYNIIDLCRLAYDKLSIQTMFDIAQTIPKPDEGLESKDSAEKKAFQKAFELARTKVNTKIAQWFTMLSDQEQSRLQGSGQLEHHILEAVPEAGLLKFLDQFFFDNYINLNEKTRSIIDFTFSGFLFRLLKEPVYSMLCRHESNFTPEDCIRGKIILINLPTKIYHKVGRDSQILFKYIWQRAMEKRVVTDSTRPLFLWADEAQTFLHENDADFQATARSSRIATVYISQNLPNFYASMGGQKAEYKVKSFLGTLGTKIFHANADIETNKYGSELIGEEYIPDRSNSTTISDGISQTSSQSWKLERMVRPEAFVSLKTGGIRNNFQCEAYIHRQGDALFNNRNYRKVAFPQNYKPQ